MMGHPLAALVPLRHSIPEHGGKAVGLRHLLERGARVPDGVALSVEAIRRILGQESRALDELDRWLARVPGRLAVRSSALVEDGESSSFAGIFETRLCVEPRREDVLAAIEFVSGSADSPRAQAYSSVRSSQIPVVIQHLVEATHSGVTFTRAVAPSGARCAYTEWTRGFGEALVSGAVTPSSFFVTWTAPGRLDLTSVETSGEMIEPAIVRECAALVELVDDGSRVQGWDIEWAADSAGTFWALQSRPVTSHILVPARGPGRESLPASSGTASGAARIVSLETLDRVGDGDVLVADITDVDFLPAMKRAAAIITEQGGLLSHAAIVARELRKPCVVAAVGACTRLVDGEIVVVDGGAGTIRQGATVLGGRGTDGIDWGSLFLYDRGLEVNLGSVPAYVEPTLDGLVVHVDDETGTGGILEVGAQARLTFRVPAPVVRSDKRIWGCEWRRFRQSGTVNILMAYFDTAIASWDARAVDFAEAALKSASRTLTRQPPVDAVDRLFHGEMGAALHGIVAVVVEGTAIWNAYRDTAKWRSRTGTTFPGFIMMTTVDSSGVDSTADDGDNTEIARIGETLRRLAMLRNEAYPWFSAEGAFNEDYFVDRGALVREAAASLGIAFEDENQCLDAIYAAEAFRNLEREFRHRAFTNIIGEITPSRQRSH